MTPSIDQRRSHLQMIPWELSLRMSLGALDSHHPIERWLILVVERSFQIGAQPFEDTLLHVRPPKVLIAARRRLAACSQ